MADNNNRTEASIVGKKHSGRKKAGGIYSRLLSLSAVLIVLMTAAGFCCLQAAAETADEKTETIVISTDSDEEFAFESSELAKKSRGLILQSTGEAKRYSSGRLIVRVKDGKKVDFSKYGATTVIESNFGVSIVQFASGSAARKAAGNIASLSAVSYVEPDDCSVAIGDMEVGDISREKISQEDISLEESTSGESWDLPAQGLQDEPPVTATPGDLQIGDKTYKKTDDLIYENTLSTGTVSQYASAMSWGSAYIQADKYAAFVKANTSRSITVAVVDGGVSSHTKLSGRLLPGKDFVDNDNNPSDRNGHGTHVAGVIVDCTPGINVKILPVRVMNAAGEGSPSVLGNGIRYAVNKGAKVINLSLGSDEHSSYIDECITYAHNQGVTVVVAAGNENMNTKFICPAHMSAPIVVGAIDSGGKRAFYSNFGSSLDIVAPGVDIRSCWLNGNYATASGTSMACPHISAVAAMYRLMNPSITPERTEYLVRCYAKDLGTKGTDQYYGRGVPRMAGSITPSSVALSKKNATIQVNNTLTLKATITPSYAGKNNLTWSSSNNNVVTVSGGKLTAKKIGDAVITVSTVNGKKATCSVTVTDGEIINVGTLKKDIGQALKQTSMSVAPFSAEESVTVEKTASAAAKTPEEIKIYIYPSEKPGNAQIRDGSIVTGSRLALEAEIVPAQKEAAALLWTSSDPGIASVDENGVVTAVSAGEVQIRAELPAEGGIAGAGDIVESAAQAAYAESLSASVGTYTLTVVKPSILTRRVSYNAGNDEEIQIDAVVRLPASLTDNSKNKDTERINPPADYVLAILRHDDGGDVLLGAVNLGGDDSGTVHLHDPGTGRKRTDITGVQGASSEEDTILTDMTSGKQASETGILYMRSEKADGSKADLSLAADIEALRAAASAGHACTEIVSECRIAVYTDAAFEEREEAAENKDTEKIRGIDENAICICSFSLSYNISAEDGEKDGQTPETGNVSDVDPRTGTEDNSGSDDNSGTGSENGKSGGDADAGEDITDGSGPDESGADSTDSTAEEQNPAEETSPGDTTDGPAAAQEPAEPNEPDGPAKTDADPDSGDTDDSSAGDTDDKNSEPEEENSTGPDTVQTMQSPSGDSAQEDAQQAEEPVMTRSTEDPVVETADEKSPSAE